jgi:sugar lactone lactonase YvrE
MQRRSLFLASAALLISGLAVSGYYLFRSESPLPTPLKAVFAKKPIVTDMLWEAQITPFAVQYSLNQDPNSAETFSDPNGIVFDAQGNIYIADAGEHNRILKINKKGETVIYAGSTEGFADAVEGGAQSAKFHTPSALAIDKAGNLYVADTGNHVIRKITPKGQVSTLAGNGVAGYRDGAAQQAQFNGPIGLAVAKDGKVYVADTYNDKIRVILPDGTVQTIAGGAAPGYQDGVGAAALFDTPSSIVINSKGELIIADTRNNAVRKINALGEVSTLIASEPKDREALLRRPAGLAITHDDHVYVSELSHGRLLQIAPSGEIRGLTGVDIDIIPGDDTSPRMRNPMAIAVNPDGNLLVSDSAMNRLHQVHRKDAKEGLSMSPQVLRIVEPVAPVAQPSLWPLLPQDQPHEVVGTIGEVRGEYGGDSRHHFHRGVDMQANIGESVVAIKNEKVSSPVPAWAAGTINEGMRVSKLSYIHMKVGRKLNEAVLDPQKFSVIKDASGKLQQVRVKRGTRFEVGEAVGTINSMYHVHLNYAPEGDVVNPLSLRFIGFEDSVIPQINRIDIADQDGKILGRPVTVATKAKGKKKDKAPAAVPQSSGPLRLSRSLEQVSIIVDAFDQADGNIARRRLGLYELGYQILNADGTPLPGFEKPKMTIRFNHLPADEEAVKVAYAENSGITVHGSAATKFLYNITNEIHDGHAIIKFWQIKDLPAGDYLIHVHAADYAGNVANRNHVLRVRLE